MVKLIRLSTEDNNARFDNKFNEDIEIKPYSKVALDNCVLETSNDTLDIDGTNDNITFQLQVGNPHTITLAHTLSGYNRNNYTKLFKDIAVKINGVMGQPFLNTPNSYNIKKELGSQVQVEVGSSSKKVNITFRQSALGYRVLNLTANIPTRTISGVANSSVLVPVQLPYNGVNQTSYIKVATVGAGNNNTSLTYYEYPLTRGCGVIRATPRKLSVVGNGAGDDTDYANGLIIGVSQNPLGSFIKKRDLLDTEIYLGLHIGSTTGLISSIKNGVFTRSTVRGTYTGDGNVANDTYEVMICGNQIRLNVYQGANLAREILIPTDYDNDLKLYPFIINRGIGTGASDSDNDCWTNVLMTGDPFQELKSIDSDDTNDSLNHIIDNVIFETTLSNGTPSQQSVETGSGFIQFEKSSMSDFLGFNNLRIPILDFQKKKRYWFYQAEDPFTFSDLSSSVLIILDNIQLESYDTVEDNNQDGGRKSILATVPQSDSSGAIIYEVQNLKYININNAYPIKLRNIKARITKNDNSPLNVNGVSRMTILVKDENE